MAQNSIPRAAPATAAPTTAALLAAYLAAHYRVRLGDGRWLALDIGRPAPAELERALPGATFTLVSACNPQSVVQAPVANEAADAALRSELDALGLATLRTVASDADGRWKEPGWLVAGLETAAADGLARRYDQAGILHWRQGEAVRLRIHRPRPAGTARRWVDWIP